jgi:hypothetical protein
MPSRPIASVHVPIQQLAKHVYRLQSKGPKALADWLVALTDSLVDGDPSRSEFGAELLAEARAFSEAKARAGKLGAEAKHGSARHSRGNARHSRGDATAELNRPLALPSQTDSQTDQGRRTDPVQEEDLMINGSKRTRGRA